MLKLTPVLLLSFVLACGGSGDALTIQSLGIDAASISQDQSARVRAGVGGPAVGGQLSGPDGAVLASFTSAGPAAFEATLAWAAVATGTFHESRDIALTATFFSGSMKATRDLKLTLTCGTGHDLCGGRCVDLKSDPANCGACDSPVDAGQICSGGTSQCNDSFKTYCPGSGCVDTRVDNNNCGACGNKCGNSCWFSQCHSFTSCFDTEKPAAPRTCAEACQLQGKVCWNLCTDHKTWADGGGVAGCFANPNTNAKRLCDDVLVGSVSASCCCRE